MTRISTQEKKWRAESDANTLIEAAMIESDPTRKKLAAQEISRIAKETKDRAKAVSKVATRTKGSSTRRRKTKKK